jgi:3-phenylpropionate/trans-cinnamate dioxygenase ferredoxin subunit
MAKHVVGPVEDFPPGTQRRVEVGRRAIAIFNAGGRLYALRDVCPHQGGPLSSGVVLGQVQARLPGEYEYDAECRYVRCPWHGWEYSLDTGASSYDPKHDRVRAYAVTVEHGAELAAERAQAQADGRLPGPYVAETIPVSVENDYVLVEV